MELLEWISDELTILAVAFGESPSEQRQEIYCRGLADIQRDRLCVAFRRARYELKYFPKLAELRELAGASLAGRGDGRSGPEEAWARMPKGNRMEDDSVVWCEEERAAYEACRSLLVNGDLIGARMAFRERYERELVEARSQGKPVRWSLSAGYDTDHRLSTLASAVEKGYMSLEGALDFVPSERRDEFALMLPHSKVKALLAGEAQGIPDLSGLAGILARMRMEGVVPKELESEPPVCGRTPADRTPEEVRELRDRLNAQIEFLKRSRNGNGTGNAGAGGNTINGEHSDNGDR